MKYAFEESVLYQQVVQFINELYALGVVYDSSERRFDDRDSSPYVSMRIFFRNESDAMLVSSMMDEWRQPFARLEGNAVCFTIYPKDSAKNPFFAQDSLVAETIKLVAIEEKIRVFNKTTALLDPAANISYDPFQALTYRSNGDPCKLLSITFSNQPKLLVMIGFLKECGDVSFSHSIEDKQLSYTCDLKNPTNNCVFQDLWEMTEEERNEIWGDLQERKRRWTTGCGFLGYSAETAQGVDDNLFGKLFSPRRTGITFWGDAPDAAKPVASSSWEYVQFFGCNLNNLEELLPNVKILKSIYITSTQKEIIEQSKRLLPVSSAITIVIETSGPKQAKALYDTMRQFDTLFNAAGLKLERNKITYDCLLVESNLFNQPPPGEETIEVFKAALLSNQETCRERKSPVSIADFPGKMFTTMPSVDAVDILDETLDLRLSWN